MQYTTIFCLGFDVIESICLRRYALTATQLSNKIYVTYIAHNTLLISMQIVSRVIREKEIVGFEL